MKLQEGRKEDKLNSRIVILLLPPYIINPHSTLSTRHGFEAIITPSLSQGLKAIGDNFSTLPASVKRHPRGQLI